MSVTYDLRNIADSGLISDDKLRTMVFATMIVGMPEVTTANAEEFTWRLNAVAPEVKVTIQDVTLCVGLKTNARIMTMGEFRRHFLRVKLPKFRRSKGGNRPPVKGDEPAEGWSPE